MSFKAIVFLLISGAGLTACSSVFQFTQIEKKVSINANITTDTAMDSLIAPYSRSLALEMNEVLGEALVDLTVQRPNSNLGHWVCDELVRFGLDTLTLDKFPVVSIINTGGLRSSLAKGPITVGELFKLMPFDNIIVAVKLPFSAMEEIKAYCAYTGGEPISGFQIDQTKITLNDESTPEFFWVVTTDFLINGGDNMTFFKSAIERIETKALLRDVLINAVKKQKKIGNSVEERITW